MLSLNALNAHYGTSHVLQGVDLELHDGTILAVLGRNGVGKTTTVRAIMGLVRPSFGNVLLDGEDIAGWSPHRVARTGIAYVPEGARGGRGGVGGGVWCGLWGGGGGRGRGEAGRGGGCRTSGGARPCALT